LRILRNNELINYVNFLTSDEPLSESWSALGEPVALAREFTGWDPLMPLRKKSMLAGRPSKKASGVLTALWVRQRMRPATADPCRLL
jgi:hypothetical protein